MKAKTKHQKEIVEKLSLFLPNPEAVLVKNRYRILYATLKQMYPKTFENIDKEVMTTLIQDIVYADRKWRKLTEGEDKKEKIRLSQEYQLNELGVEVGLNQNIKLLKNENN